MSQRTMERGAIYAARKREHAARVEALRVLRSLIEQARTHRHPSAARRMILDRIKVLQTAVSMAGMMYGDPNSREPFLLMSFCSCAY